MKHSLLLTISILLLLGILSPGCHGQNTSLDYLFESGSDGYHTFRIPAIISTAEGSILAFAEGRKNGSSDTGDIDLVMKKSSDGGKTWSKLKVLWDDGDNVCGNPAPVVDRSSGTIFLLSTWNLGEDHESEIIRQTSKDSRRIFILESSDEGNSWSQPREITSSVKQEDWTWYATGPCHGIQVSTGRFKDRLIIPCDHIEAETKKYFSHIIYSDDHGKSWHLGGTTPQDKVNECSIAELPDGALMLNMRNYDRKEKSRKVSLSEDGGLTWGDIYPDRNLIEPICQGSLLRYSYQESGKSRMLFSNPANNEKRLNMTLKISYDEGKTWEKSLVLFSGPSAYSDLVKLPDGSIGCLFEAGNKNPYEGIVYRVINLNEIE